MHVLGVDVPVRDVVLGLVAAPVVLVGLWAVMALIYAVVPS